MKHFLEIIAAGYAKKYKDLSRLTFVMPNKRSGYFLLRYFQQLYDEPVLAPQIVSITDFIARSIPAICDSRLDLLFRLYESYRRVQDNFNMSFEKFSTWGDTMLGDFNEVDMHMVTPDELFKNVADLNYIRTDFLSEEQKKVMVEYFGCSPDEMFKEAQRFWKGFDRLDGDVKNPGEKRGSRKEFLSLWQLLPLIYKDFKKNLKEAGLTTEGGAYREAAERIENGYEPFRGDKLVFVGFNALAESERRIFFALKHMKVVIDGNTERKADFVWDIISNNIVDYKNPAVKFVRINARDDNFPSPEWLVPDLYLNLPDHKPKVEVVAVPSNIMQVKVASEILDHWKTSLRQPVSSGDALQNPDCSEKDSVSLPPDSHIAVVLADERLLLPLLHSLPKEYPDPNLTMGFPLKHTSVISYASLLRKLHMHSRYSEHEDIFLFEDVRDLLSHPYSHVLFTSTDIWKVISNVEDSRRLIVSSAVLENLGENASLLFRHFGENTPSTEVISYIKDVFGKVKNNLYRRSSYLNSNLEKAYIAAYEDALVRLSNCLGEYDIMLTPVGVFNLADRLISGEKVTFEGRPLKGLQVMGMLETRCLDFERVVILSVNEKVIPRVGRTSTFIPNVIRVAFGMPPAHYQEELFAYYFFRILARSNQALLTYDSRSSNSRTPGPSRYLLQMKYLPGAFEYSEKEARFGIPANYCGKLEIPKEGEISERLDRFEVQPMELSSDTGKSDIKNFSASALDNYMGCQLKFLYQNVLELYVEEEKLETINAIDLGRIIHGAIEQLYIPKNEDRGHFLTSPKVMTYSKLQGILNQKTANGESLIEEVVKREIIRKHFHVTEEQVAKGQLHGSAVFLLDYIVNYVKNIIRADMQQAPFRLWGTEIKGTVPYPLNDGRVVNVKMVIDRLDQEGESGDNSFRIIDYKTGTVHIEAPAFEDIFKGNYKAHNIFQLFLYAELLVFMVEKGTIQLPKEIDRDRFIQNLNVAIYAVLQLPDDKGIMFPKIDNVKISSLADLHAYEADNGVSFRNLLDDLLSEILNREKPFRGEISDRQCAWCDYRLRCESLAAIRNSDHKASN